MFNIEEATILFEYIAWMPACIVRTQLLLVAMCCRARVEFNLHDAMMVILSSHSSACHPLILAIRSYLTNSLSFTNLSHRPLSEENSKSE